MRQHCSILRPTLLALGLLTGAAIHLPAQAAGGLAPLTQGLIAPGDISGGVIFGKNGEVIPLDAKGKPQSPCVMSKAAGQGAKTSKLPECKSGSSAERTDAGGATPKDGGTPCQGYYTIWMNNMPIKIWYPPGCTPQ